MKKGVGKEKYIHMNNYVFIYCFIFVCRNLQFLKMGFAHQAFQSSQMLLGGTKIYMSSISLTISSMWPAQNQLLRWVFMHLFLVELLRLEFFIRLYLPSRGHCVHYLRNLQESLKQQELFIRFSFTSQGLFWGSLHENMFPEIRTESINFEWTIRQSTVDSSDICSTNMIRCRFFDSLLNRQAIVTSTESLPMGEGFSKNFYKIELL